MPETRTKTYECLLVEKLLNQLMYAEVSPELLDVNTAMVGYGWPFSMVA
jgi:hypothetical protein